MIAAWAAPLSNIYTIDFQGVHSVSYYPKPTGSDGIFDRSLCERNIDRPEFTSENIGPELKSKNSPEALLMEILRGIFIWDYRRGRQGCMTKGE
jgi:hypothetical protein